MGANFHSVLACGVIIKKDFLDSKCDLINVEDVGVITLINGERIKYVFACLNSTLEPITSIDVYGPYEIPTQHVKVKKLHKLQKFVSADEITKLKEAYTVLTGGKDIEEVEVGYHAVSTSEMYYVKYDPDLIEWKLTLDEMHESGDGEEEEEEDHKDPWGERRGVQFTVFDEDELREYTIEE